MDQKFLEEKIQNYYASGTEADRLVSLSAGGLVEAAEVRKELANLPASSRILDIGGGTGVHASWLAERGHQVVLIDPVPAHIEIAQAHGGFDALEGDARDLPFEDASFDAVLMFGPLYHLIEPADRLLSLQQAHRVLKPQGLLFCAGNSRISAFLNSLLAAPELTAERINTAPLLTGNWVNQGEGYPGGHFHTRAELEQEILAADFADVSIRGLELSMIFEFYPADQQLAQLVVQLHERMAEIDNEGKRAKYTADLSPHLFASAVKR